MYGNTLVTSSKRAYPEPWADQIRMLDYYTRMHLEEINLHGDPALR